MWLLWLEPWTSGAGSNCSTNCGTFLALPTCFIKLFINLIFQQPLLYLTVKKAASCKSRWDGWTSVSFPSPVLLLAIIHHRLIFFSLPLSRACSLSVSLSLSFILPHMLAYTHARTNTSLLAHTHTHAHACSHTHFLWRPKRDHSSLILPS